MTGVLRCELIEVRQDEGAAEQLPDSYTASFFATDESQAVRQTYDTARQRPEHYAAYQQRTLDRFVSSEFRELARLALAQYPDYPYHQAAHGLDVINTTARLLDQVPGVTPEQQQALLVAAAVHDTQFTHDASPDAAWRQQRHGKEGLALQTFRSLARLSNALGYDQAQVVRRGVLGTIMLPQTPYRDNLWGRLLHHADLGYVWGNADSFLVQAMRFRIEECGQKSWSEFQQLEAGFLTSYQEALLTDLPRCGIAQPQVDAMARQVATNRQLICELDQEPSPETYRNWPIPQL